MTPRPTSLSATWAWLLLTSACQLFIDQDALSERQDGATAHEPTTSPLGDKTQVASDCDSYCSEVLGACSDGHDAYISSAGYASMEVCLALCAYISPGVAGEDNPRGNTLACRRRNARMARDLELERSTYCPAAGPGGGAPDTSPNCGSNCASYCWFYQQICDPQLDSSACLLRCAGLPDTGTIAANRDYALSSDTVQCRLAHLSVAAYTDPEVHCDHARLIPAQDGSFGCDLPASAEPSCEDYCKLVGAACSGDSAIYESLQQCLDVCAQLPKGTAEMTQGDSLACRRWRAYAALLEPQIQCPSAGLIAAGPCGDPCRSYCDSLAGACGREFASTFGSAGACRAQCAALRFDGGFSLERADDPGTLQCRVLALNRAVSGELRACAEAAGGGDCR